jgi:hypothetical protein
MVGVILRSMEVGQLHHGQEGNQNRAHQYPDRPRAALAVADFPAAAVSCPKLVGVGGQKAFPTYQGYTNARPAYTNAAPAYTSLDASPHAKVYRQSPIRARATPTPVGSVRLN